MNMFKFSQTKKIYNSFCMQEHSHPLFWLFKPKRLQLNLLWYLLFFLIELITCIWDTFKKSKFYFIGFCGCVSVVYIWEILWQHKMTVFKSNFRLYDRSSLNNLGSYVTILWLKVIMRLFFSDENQKQKHVQVWAYNSKRPMFKEEFMNDTKNRNFPKREGTAHWCHNLLISLPKLV